MRSATCQLTFRLTLSQASCLASFCLQLRTSSPQYSTAFRGLGPPTSTDNQENGSQSCPQSNIKKRQLITQQRLPFQQTLSCAKRTVHANQDSISMLFSHTHCHSISIPGSGGNQNRKHPSGGIQPLCLLPGLCPLEKCLAESGPSIHICRINIYLHKSSTSISSSSQMMRLHRIMNLITLCDKEAFLMLLPPLCNTQNTVT